MRRNVEGLVDNMPKILKAVGTILEGTVKRADVTSDIKVYECKNVIRVDLKITEEEE